MNEEQLWHYRARLVRLIDADTLELELDTGFHSRHIERVRVADVNAPEQNTDAGKAATAWGAHWMEMVGARTSDSWPLLVHTRMVDSRRGVLQDMSLGRYVATVCSAWSGESYGDALVAAGHAVQV